MLLVQSTLKASICQQLQHPFYLTIVQTIILLGGIQAEPVGEVLNTETAPYPLNPAQYRAPGIADIQTRHPGNLDR